MASLVIARDAQRVALNLVEADGDVYLTADEGNGAVRVLRFRGTGPNRGKFSRLKSAADVAAFKTLDDGRWAIPA